jgi:uncharacterized SAM-binding protein YcdF (DUF218 family)
MAQRFDTDGMQPVVIPPDGFAMLALSFVLILVSLGASLLVAFSYVLWVAWRTPHVGPTGTPIVVLGTRLDTTGEPTPCYAARLARAGMLWQQARDSRIIILGGSTAPGARSESGAGAAYLRAQGVPADRIDIEDRSRHTLENLKHYRERFSRRTAGQLLLVTSRFHLARSSMLAAGLGIAHTPCSAEDRRMAALRDVPRILNEALLLHWYVTGRCFARLTGNRRMAARIS